METNETEEEVMRSLLLRIYYASVAMDTKAMQKALEDVDRYFRESNMN